MKHLFTLLFACLLYPGVRAQTYVSVTEQDSLTAAQARGPLPINAQYDVVTYKVLYNTIDALGDSTVASGLLAIPDERNLSLPITVYMHGTVTDREAVPSREGVTERGISTAFASLGYISVAPDYIGLGDNEGFHPYVHAASEASAGYDLILAAQQWMREQDIAFNEQLFLTGYSQGGHAVQALHRAIQDTYEGPGDTLSVTAASHLSGPYSISEVMREATLAEGQPTLPGYIVYTYISYNNVYGLYDSLGSAFVQPYLDVIKEYDAEEIDGGEFNSRLSTLLEENDDRLIDMFQDSIREQIVSNDENSRTVQALRDNDTYDWAPEAPTLLYYCTADEQVPFRNAILADSVMRQNGSTSVTLQNGGALSHNGCAPFALLATLGLFDQYATFEPIVSARQLLRLPELSISPNPVSAGREVRLNGLPNGQVHYTLYDVSGRALWQGQLDGHGVIQTPTTLHPGLHVLRLTLPNGNFAVRKLMLR